MPARSITTEARHLNGKRWAGRAMRGASVVVGLAATGYVAYVGLAWYRYGNVTAPLTEESDALLDEFMPEYEVAERHHVRVRAPANVTLAAAMETDLPKSDVIRGVLEARALILGADPDDGNRPRGLLAQTTSLGWGVLAEKPGLEIVVGAVTQPWMANVVFRALLRDDFRVSPTRLRQDRVDASCRSRRPAGIDLPDRDARVDDRFNRAKQVPMVLGEIFAGHCSHPALDPHASEADAEGRAQQ